MPQTLLVTVMGRKVDLFNSMNRASNADWRALTAETGLGPFLIAKRLQAMQLLQRVFLQQREGESADDFEARLTESVDKPLGFDESKFTETVTALVWLAFRADKSTERMTFAELDEKIPFWEAMGAFQEVAEFQESQSLAGDAEDPTMPPTNSDPAVAGAAAEPVKTTTSRTSKRR